MSAYFPRPAAWLAVVGFLISCAAALPNQTSRLESGKQGAQPGHRAPRADSVRRSGLSSAAPATEEMGERGRAVEPPAPKPLGPLRKFTKKEWRRIRSVQRYVDRAAKRYRFSPSLINGVIWVESKFERRVRSRKGPRGLMQIMPRTARAMARQLRRRYMPNSADFSILVGTHYLSLMLDRFQSDLHLALAAYNRGPAHIKAWQAEGAHLPKPRVPYVSRVMRAARAFCVRRKLSKYERSQGPFVCPQLEDANR